MKKFSLLFLLILFIGCANGNKYNLEKLEGTPEITKGNTGYVEDEGNINN